MNKKTKVLLFVFVGLFMVLLAVTLFPRGEADPDLGVPGWAVGKKVDKAEEEAPYDRIEVRMGGKAVTLTRGADKKWKMSPPEGARADAYKVRQIVEAFKDGLSSVVSSRLEGEADLAAFGLDDANRVEVTLSKGGADAVTIDIGSVQKPERGTYGEGDTFVRLKGHERAYRLIQKDLRRPFEDGIKGLRDRKVFDFEANDVTRLSARNPVAPDEQDRAFTLASEEKPAPEPKEGEKKKPERVWRFEAPPGLAAGDVRSWLAQIAGLYAQEYVEDLPKDVTIGPDAYAIELVLADGRKVVLSVSETSGESAYVRVEGMDGFAKIAKYTADQIRKKVVDLRDKTIFGVKREDVTGFEVVDGETRLAVARTDSGLKATTPAGLPVGRAAVEQVLADIETLKADSIVPPSALAGVDTGLDRPAVTVTVRLRDGGTRVLKVGKEKEKGVFFAQVSGSQDVLTIPQWALAKVRKSPSDLRNKKVFDFEEASIATVELVHPDETVRLVRETGADGKPTWKATAPRAEAGLKADAVRSLATTLGGLTAKEIVAGKPPAAVGLAGSQDLLVTITLADGSRHVLRVSAEKKDGDPYAVTPTEADFRGTVFTLNQWQVKNFQKRLKELM